MVANLKGHRSRTGITSDDADGSSYRVEEYVREPRVRTHIVYETAPRDDAHFRVVVPLPMPALMFGKAEMTNGETPNAHAFRRGEHEVYFSKPTVPIAQDRVLRSHLRR
jgi:hypothetical protein